MVSKYALNLEQGSYRSLEFLESVAKMNDEALYSEFATAIEYKWIKDNVYVKALACLYFTFVILLNSYVFTSKIEEWHSFNLFIMAALFVITFILWSYEIT